MAFNLFGKPDNDLQDIVFSDRTFISEEAKLKASLALAKEDATVIFIAWFSDTAKLFKDYFNQHAMDESKIFEARNVHAALVQQKKPVFTEHHPLRSKELELVKNWSQKDLIVFNSLEEPIFKHYGGDKIIALMEMLGMKEEEPIEHPMVSKSIINIQKKIASQLSFEQSAHSQFDWIKKNIK